jgi:hypothetical protein
MQKKITGKQVKTFHMSGKNGKPIRFKGWSFQFNLKEHRIVITVFK